MSRRVRVKGQPRTYPRRRMMARTTATSASAERDGRSDACDRHAQGRASDDEGATGHGVMQPGRGIDRELIAWGIADRLCLIGELIKEPW